MNTNRHGGKINNRTCIQVGTDYYGRARLAKHTVLIGFAKQGTKWRWKDRVKKLPHSRLVLTYPVTNSAFSRVCACKTAKTCLAKLLLPP